jgi:hypothetical protein
MKATLDLAVGNVLSVKAAVRTTPTGLVAAALLAAGFTCKGTAGRKTSSAIVKPEGKR